MLSSDRRFVFILGMHRSGTSCLTGALETTGLALGEVNRAHRDNKLGNRESITVWRINDRILAHNNGSWKEPPDSIDVTEEHQTSIKEYLSNFGKEKLIGIKDPRMVLVSEPWLTAAKSFQLVGTFRHPLAVANSLQKRNAIPVEQGINLWIRYNQRLLELQRTHNFPVIEYDLSNYEDYCENVAQLASQIGLTKNVEAIRQFVSTELQHAYPASQEVPPSCRELYSELRRIRFTS